MKYLYLIFSIFYIALAITSFIAKEQCFTVGYTAMSLGTLCLYKIEDKK